MKCYTVTNSDYCRVRKGYNGARSACPMDCSWLEHDRYGNHCTKVAMRKNKNGVYK